jgi:fluoride exporter
MQGVFLVFVGGGAGAVLRYVAGIGAVLLMGAAFPYGTLFVNVTGSFMIGFFAPVLSASSGEDGLRLLLITGVLGGFTTFSAFSLETLHLVQRGDAALALAYCAASLMLSFAAVALGWSAGKMI